MAQYILVLTAKSRAEAQIAEGLLQTSGIKSVSKQGLATEALSTIRGNAVLPFEQWGVYVEEQFKNKAEEILKEVQTDYLPVKISETPARKVSKPFIWIFLVLFFGFMIVSFYYITVEIINSR